MFTKFSHAFLLPTGASIPPVGCSRATRPIPVQVLGTRDVPAGTVVAIRPLAACHVFHVPPEVLAVHLTTDPQE